MDLDPTTIYAICLGGLLVLSFAVTCVIPSFRAGLRVLLLYARVSLLDRYVLRRHALAGPWTVSCVLVQVIYLGGNIWSLWFGHNSAERVAARAGRLALVNAAPLFLALHLSFLADLLGVSLQTCKRLHRSCGLMTAAHVAVHGIATTVGASRGGELRTPRLYESTVHPPEDTFAPLLTVLFSRPLDSRLFSSCSPYLSFVDALTFFIAIVNAFWKPLFHSTPMTRLHCH